MRKMLLHSFHELKMMLGVDRAIHQGDKDLIKFLKGFKKSLKSSEHDVILTRMKSADLTGENLSEVLAKYETMDPTLKKSVDRNEFIFMVLLEDLKMKSERLVKTLEKYKGMSVDKSTPEENSIVEQVKKWKPVQVSIFASRRARRGV